MAETVHCTDDELQRYLDGSLTAGKGRLEAHVRACRYCRGQLEAYERVFAFARNEMDPRPAEGGLGRALRARVFHPRKAAPAADRFLLGAVFGLSAALIIVCLILVLRPTLPADLIASILGVAGMLALLAVKETNLLKRITNSIPGARFARPQAGLRAGG
jgi:anti-sigma factor RsiW